eukprot:GHVN01067755.1.p1 GENE.GHVN01067755.1~~GHVN01067755.1.p1  ORF type:complete len:146 (+),score=15.87 GHVN01067755.1:36-473(+)
MKYSRRHIDQKIEEWERGVSQLSKIAEDEPQTALTLMTKSLQHRWTFCQRVNEITDDQLKGLETMVRRDLLPSILGRTFSNDERALFALPAKLGGLSVPVPHTLSTKNHKSSQELIATLQRCIMGQTEWEPREHDKQVVATRQAQ